MTIQAEAGYTLETYRTVNPATGEVLRTWEWPTADELEARIALAHQAFLSWRMVPIEEKARVLLRFAELLDDNADALGRQTSIEMGKPLVQAVGEAHFAASIYRYFAQRGAELLADEVVEVPGIPTTLVCREPVGIVLGIEPWNAPLFQPMRVAAPNLMLGNTVLLKPAEITPGSSVMFDDLFLKAGFPEGAYQTILVSKEQTSTVIADPRVRAVALTGSDRAGSAVGEQASRHIKPLVLELGGSDAFVVLDRADVPKAAATAATCRLIIGGQACALPKRVIVTDKVADEFIEHYLPVFTGQVMGDPLDPETTLGPMSSDAAADLLQAQYQDAIDKGATVLLEGGRVAGPGAYFKPAVITGITPDMRVYSEEAFGPLGMIYRVPDADAAVTLANESKYGLGGAVFSEDLAEARRVARLLDTGGVGVNMFLGSPVEIPFGGTKNSGVGRELGRSGMDQFANIKTYGIA
ncbi:aldehyde dehydrogenase family protein [Jatrophihabitans sp.]|uniref:aldehyde dehydrogenase family protein n=1 Tax=Jatrophihabitans sp. TaxID=1932789 RepID=UPI0030C771E7|nr:aldehyde dehydrogenase-like protein yneI [Jatrophihabitans sp.]